MAKRPGSTNRLRIIGGLHGGRKLQFPDSRGLRPTADRIRETLFNWLRNEISGSRCLDLFAGSGALGFEAASRGAKHVMLVEPVAPVARQLRINIELLQMQDVMQVHQCKAANYLAKAQGKFDLVFLDPPFADNLLPDTLSLLASEHVLAQEALIYIERDARQALPVLTEGWHILRDKTAGHVSYSLLSTAGQLS